jgi:hypothetical protein
MKRLLIVLLLTGCTTTVPVTGKFPYAPETLMEKCPELTKLQKDAKLSDVATVVKNNYSLYHECSYKVEQWQTWYAEQQQNYEKVR